ncbi:MAG: SprT-like domain-containing protein [Clostridia bacterium]|nr:SprT-like domain-containing protein [Clostridia bacterium]
MDEKLIEIYNECVNELKLIGIDVLDEKRVGKIDIHLSKRNNKRYGCCKQEEPDKAYKTVIKQGWKRIIKYEKFNVHHIEISKWVMDLDKNIIKNTIIHELIHCMPYCNNHGLHFKKYANYINIKLGYNISRVGNKKEDFEKSNVEYNEEELFKYKVICTKCGKEFYRKRMEKNFTRKYRCATCKGKLEVIQLR